VEFLSFVARVADRQDKALFRAVVESTQLSTVAS
jgi:hypothetical protein